MNTGPKVRPRPRARRPRTWRDVALVVAGSLVAALSFNLLLRPAGIAPGGVVGLSLLLERTTGLAPAWGQGLANGALLALGGLLLGRAFLWRSLLGSALLPVFVALTSGLAPLTREPLLAALCGGTVSGAAIGLVFLGRGSVGGFTAMALVVQRRFGVPVDRTIVLLDAAVLVGAAWIFSVEQALCAAVGSVLIGRTARAALTWGDHAKLALVVTSAGDAVTEALLHEGDLGVTRLAGTGGYTGDPREILLVVMRPTDVPRLKRLVSEHDARAFVTLTDASEVLGYGFKSHE
jgi:uncharacterized membrane-anchored protein YitT (DUF2179 family)